MVRHEELHSPDIPDPLGRFASNAKASPCQGWFNVITTFGPDVAGMIETYPGRDFVVTVKFE